MKSKLLMSFLVIALVSALVGGATFAWFTDTATNEGNIFSTGTLSLDITNPTSGAAFTTSNMAPGGSQTGSITVQNTGSLPLKFRGYATDITNSDADNPLSAILNVVVRLGSTEIYNGTLDGLASVTAMPVYPNLAPEATATFDFTVSLPTSAGNEYQGDNVTAIIRFDAAQVNGEFQL